MLIQYPKRFYHWSAKRSRWRFYFISPLLFSERGDLLQRLCSVCPHFCVVLRIQKAGEYVFTVPVKCGSSHKAAYRKDGVAQGLQKPRILRRNCAERFVERIEHAARGIVRAFSGLCDERGQMHADPLRFDEARDDFAFGACPVAGKLFKHCIGTGDVFDKNRTLLRQPIFKYFCK